ncbi:MAG: hypothetical protein AB7F99_03665 [Vicinamibacterales bacterium]
MTTFWCGPPLAEFTDERAAEIAAAGFTVVGPPCEGGLDPAGNLRALDIAGRHGLTVWVADYRFDERAPTRPDWQANLRQAVAEYKAHPAFGGYFVADEPTTEDFPQLAAIVGQLRELDPGRLYYINLYPDYADHLTGASTYREYVDGFVSMLQPPILSYDYYALGVEGDRQTFFDNLSLIRELGLRANVPFMLILQAMPHGPYRDPTEAELSWQALHALAYGARGISYFAYWTPVDVEFAGLWKFRHGLIENGTATQHYYEAARVNAIVNAIANELAGFTSLSIGDSTSDAASPLQLGSSIGVEGGAVTAGLFGDANGTEAALLVNRDYRQAAAVTLRMQNGVRGLQEFDVASRSWKERRGSPLRLPAGGGVLLRWTSED